MRAWIAKVVRENNFRTEPLRGSGIKKGKMKNKNRKNIF
jgi:hypothetical protein